MARRGKQELEERTMRKIIKGKLYNTENAELLAEGGNSLPASDFRNCCESLYLKKTGEYFIYGVGGPLSRWAAPPTLPPPRRPRKLWGCSVQKPPSRSRAGMDGGEGIKPLTKAEARSWVERECNDRYEEIFGPVEE